MRSVHTLHNVLSLGHIKRKPKRRIEHERKQNSRNQTAFEILHGVGAAQRLSSGVQSDSDGEGERMSRKNAERLIADILSLSNAQYMEPIKRAKETGLYRENRAENSE